MRNLADGRIRWGFFPPGAKTDRTGKGIWLGGEADAVDEEDDDEDRDHHSIPDEDGLETEESDVSSDGETESKKVRWADGGDNSPSEDATSDEDVEEEEGQRSTPGGFFAALDIDDASDNDEESEEEEHEA